MHSRFSKSKVIKKKDRDSYLLNAVAWLETDFFNLDASLTALRRKFIKKEVKKRYGESIKRIYLARELTEEEKPQLENDIHLNADEELTLKIHKLKTRLFSGFPSDDTLSRNFHSYLSGIFYSYFINASEDFKNWVALEENKDNDVKDNISDYQTFHPKMTDSFAEAFFRGLLAEENALVIFLPKGRILDLKGLGITPYFFWDEEKEALFLHAHGQNTLINDPSLKETMFFTFGDSTVPSSRSRYRFSLIEKDILNRLRPLLPPLTSPFSCFNGLNLVDAEDSRIFLREKKKAKEEAIKLNRNQGRDYQAFFRKQLKGHVDEVDKKHLLDIQFTHLILEDVNKLTKTEQKRLFKSLIKARAYGAHVLEGVEAKDIPLRLRTILTVNQLKTKKEDFFSAYQKGESLFFDAEAQNKSDMKLSLSLLFQCPSEIKARCLNVSLSSSTVIEGLKVLSSQPKRFDTFILSLPSFPWNGETQQAFKVFLRNIQVDQLELKFPKDQIQDDLKKATLEQGLRWIGDLMEELPLSTTQVQVQTQDSDKYSTLQEQNWQQLYSNANQRLAALFQAQQEKNLDFFESLPSLTHEMQHERHQEKQLNQEITQEIIQQAIGYRLFEHTVERTLPYASETIERAREYWNAYHNSEKWSKELNTVWDAKLNKMVDLKSVAAHIAVLDTALNTLPTWSECLNLHISQGAATELLPGGRYALLGESGLNLDYLPQGFYLDKDSQGQIILYFNQAAYDKRKLNHSITPLHFPLALHSKDYPTKEVIQNLYDLRSLIGMEFINIPKGKLPYANRDKIEMARQCYQGWQEERKSLFKSWIALHDQTLPVNYPFLVEAFDYFLIELERRNLPLPPAFEFKNSEVIKKQKINALVLLQNILSVLDRIPEEQDRILEQFSEYDWTCVGLAQALRSPEYQQMRFIRPEMCLDFMHGKPSCFQLSDIKNFIYRRNEVFPEPEMFCQQIYRALGAQAPETYTSKKNHIDFILGLEMKGFQIISRFGYETKEQAAQREEKGKKGRGGLNLHSSEKEAYQSRDQGTPNAYFVKYTMAALALVTTSDHDLTSSEKICIQDVYNLIIQFTSSVDSFSLSDSYLRERLQRFVEMYETIIQAAKDKQLSHAEALLCFCEKWQDYQNPEHSSVFRYHQPLEWMLSHGVSDSTVRLHALNRNPRRVTGSYLLLDQSLQTRLEELTLADNPEILTVCLKIIGVCKWFLPRASQELTLSAILTRFENDKPADSKTYFQQAHDYLIKQTEALRQDFDDFLSDKNSHYYYSGWDGAPQESTKQNYFAGFQYNPDLAPVEIAPIISPPSSLPESKSLKPIPIPIKPQLSENIEKRFTAERDPNVKIDFYYPEFSSDSSQLARLIDGLTIQTFSLDLNEPVRRKELLKYELKCLEKRRDEIGSLHSSFTLPEITSIIAEVRAAYHDPTRSESSKQTLKLYALEMMCQAYRTTSPSQHYPNQAQILAVLDSMEAKRCKENPLLNIQAGEGKTLISALLIGMEWFLNAEATGFDLLTTRRDTAKKQEKELKQFFSSIGLNPMDVESMSIEEYLLENVVCIGQDEMMASFLQSHRKTLLKHQKKHIGFFDEGDQRLDKKIDINQSISHPYLTTEFYRKLNNCIDLENFPSKGTVEEKFVFVKQHIHLDIELRQLCSTEDEIKHYINAAEQAKVLKNKGENKSFIKVINPNDGTISIKPLSEATGVPTDLQFGDLHPFLLSRYLCEETRQALDPPGILLQSNTYSSFLRDHYKEWTILTGTAGDAYEVAQLNREGATVHYYLPFNQDQLDVSHRMLSNSAQKGLACEEEIRGVRGTAKHYGVKAPPHWIIVDDIEAADALYEHFILSGLFTEEQIKLATGQESEEAVLSWCENQPKCLVITTIFGRATDYKHKPKSLGGENLDPKGTQFSFFSKTLFALLSLFKPIYRYFLNKPEVVLGLHVMVVPGKKVNNTRWVTQAVRRTARFGTPGRSLILTSPEDYQQAKKRKNQWENVVLGDYFKTHARDPFIETILKIGDKLDVAAETKGDNKIIYQLMRKGFQESLKTTLRSLNNKLLQARKKGKFRTQEDQLRWRNKQQQAFLAQLKVNMLDQLEQEDLEDAIPLIEEFLSQTEKIALEEEILPPEKKNSFEESSPTLLRFSWIQQHTFLYDIEKEDLFSVLDKTIGELAKKIGFPKGAFPSGASIPEIFSEVVNTYFNDKHTPKDPLVLHHLAELAWWLDAEIPRLSPMSMQSILLSAYRAYGERCVKDEKSLEQALTLFEEGLEDFKDQYKDSQLQELQTVFFEKNLTFLASQLGNYAKKITISRSRKQAAENIKFHLIQKEEGISPTCRKLLEIQRSYLRDCNFNKDYIHSRFYKLLEKSIECLQAQLYREDPLAYLMLLKSQLCQNLEELEGHASESPSLKKDLQAVEEVLKEKDSLDFSILYPRFLALRDSYKKREGKQEKNALWDLTLRSLEDLAVKPFIFENNRHTSSFSSSSQFHFFKKTKQSYQEELKNLLKDLAGQGFTKSDTLLGNLAGELKTIAQHYNPIRAYHEAIQIIQKTFVPSPLIPFPTGRSLTEYLSSQYHLYLLLKSFLDHLQHGKIHAVFTSLYLLSNTFQDNWPIPNLLIRTVISSLKKENNAAFFDLCLKSKWLLDNKVPKNKVFDETLHLFFDQASDAEKKQITDKIKVGDEKEKTEEVFQDWEEIQDKMYLCFNDVLREDGIEIKQQIQQLNYRLTKKGNTFSEGCYLEGARENMKSMLSWHEKLNPAISSPHLLTTPS